MVLTGGMEQMILTVLMELTVQLGPQALPEPMVLTELMVQLEPQALPEPMELTQLPTAVQRSP